ncbi:MAG: ABC transporter substrate-binding protein [Actinomycetes bacterium]
MAQAKVKAAGLLAPCLLAATVILASCGNAPSQTTSGQHLAPGVTETAIHIGALATLSGPIAADFAAIIPGVKAYISMVNSQGGVAGRKIILDHVIDDMSSPSSDIQGARTLVHQNKVFAVVGVATAFFTGSDFLAHSGTPTFGFATQDVWRDAPNLFAAYGSVVDYSATDTQVPYLASVKHAKSVGLLAYGVPQSAAVCAAVEASMKRNGITVGFSDLNVPYGGDLSADVIRMRAAGVDFAVSCMDVSGNVALAQKAHQYGMDDINTVWYDGYNASVAKRYGSLLNHTYFLLQHVPFEAATQYPGVYPGLERYLSTMARYQPADAHSEVALQGWLSADLFVQGLRAVGRDLTQAKLVAAINRLHAYNGSGISTPTDWTKAHSLVTSPACEAFVQGSSTSPTGFAMTLNKGQVPWLCFPTKGASLRHPVRPPLGSPGT